MDKQTDKLTSLALKGAFKKGIEVLLQHKDEVNALNVFPVPDGDTGSNMSACMLEALKEIDKITFESMKNVVQAIRTGTLMGARGNSGVILSQIFSGFCATITNANVSEISIPLFAEALKKGSEVAKSAVIKPVRGTILTLIDDLAQYSAKISETASDFPVFFQRLTKRSFQVVEKTREMMPKLKQAGVVDAGAKGLAYIIEGFYRYSIGEPINLQVGGEMAGATTQGVFQRETLTYQYCTEFMARLHKGVENGNLRQLKTSLLERGDSLVLVQDSALLKGHIHTDHPGEIFETVLRYGELMKVKVDNMKEQHESLLGETPTDEPLRTVRSGGHPSSTGYLSPGFTVEVEEPTDIPEVPFVDLETGEVKSMTEEETKENGFVAVSPGEGISRLFKDLNVDQVIPGGQTMNPSTADIAGAIDRVNARHVFVLPNNPNITLAAQSASRMMSGDKKTVYVVESNSVQEGIAAILAFNEIVTPESNFENMNSALKDIVSISVTHAIRDSEIENNEITEGEYLFFANKELIAHGAVLHDVIMEGLNKVGSDRFLTINIFYGMDIEEPEAQRLREAIAQQYPAAEIEVFEGSQPHYSYFISLE